MKQFPKLPQNWQPNVVVRVGSKLKAYYQDGYYTNIFTWSGFGLTYETHEVEYDYNLEDLQKE